MCILSKHLQVSCPVSQIMSPFYFIFTAPVKPQIRKTPYTQRFIVNNNPTPLNIGVGIELRILAYRELAIYCIAKGFPPPVISWEKNGYPIESNDDIRIEKEGRKLLFPRLVPSQSGKYTCVASNAAGQDRKRTILRARCKYNCAPVRLPGEIMVY